MKLQLPYIGEPSYLCLFFQTGIEGSQPHQPHSSLRLPSQRLAVLIYNIRERVTSRTSAPTAAEPTVAPTEPLKPCTDPSKTEPNQCSDLWSNGLQLEHRNDWNSPEVCDGPYKF
ncbi:hypothetical protein RUM44_010149 [Polyplax serrata]|uniref:Uncharacterized protein n=1 Tax=Polyplax serrata TaxID=468196 RepID=A0ABR1AUQ0_POLSC